MGEGTGAVAGLVEAVGPSGHEEVVVHHDRATGLRAIIAIHSTARGRGAGRHPVLPVRHRRGRPRRRPGAARGDDLQERARRARPRRRQGGDHRRPAHGQDARRCCARTAASSSRWAGATSPPGDVGTYVADMDVDARECRCVTGPVARARRRGRLRSLTAWGVFQGMRAAAEHVWGDAEPGRAPGRRGGPRQGRAAGWSGTCVEDGAAVVRHDVPGPTRSPTVLASYPGTVAWPPRTLVAEPTGRLRAVRARRGAERRGRRRRWRAHGRLRGGEQPAGAPGHRGRCWPTAASSTCRTSW